MQSILNRIEELERAVGAADRLTHSDIARVFRLVLRDWDCREAPPTPNLARMLSDERYTEEEKTFLSHLNCCNQCLEKFEIEKSFKQFLTEKISRHPIPSQLVDQIRSRILGKADR